MYYKNIKIKIEKKSERNDKKIMIEKINIEVMTEEKEIKRSGKIKKKENENSRER